MFQIPKQQASKQHLIDLGKSGQGPSQELSWTSQHGVLFCIGFPPRAGASGPSGGSLPPLCSSAEPPPGAIPPVWALKCLEETFSAVG